MIYAVAKRMTLAFVISPLSISLELSREIKYTFLFEIVLLALLNWGATKIYHVQIVIYNWFNVHMYYRKIFFCNYGNLQLR